jgi:hypothetical protein
MAGFTIGLLGLNKTLAKLQKDVNEVTIEINGSIGGGVQNMSRMAGRLAPRDSGFLAGKISADEKDFLSWELVAQGSYAPFMEFGTKRKVSIPNGAENIAAQFKGKKSGNLDQMEKSLTEWVKRKGLSGTYSVKTKKRTGNKANRADEDKKVARAIMFYILKHGVKPQPFFFPAYFAYRPQIIKDVIKILREKRS